MKLGMREKAECEVREIEMQIKNGVKRQGGKKILDEKCIVKM